MQDMLEAGVHFGHKVSRGNPRMKPFIFGSRDGIHIIDLAQSEEYLKKAADEAHRLGKEGKVLLVVGTKKQSRDIVLALAKEANTPYLNFKWVGGFMTNFDEVRKNISKLNGLKKEKAEGTLSRYTKKEQLLIARKLEKFERELGGIATMEKLPDALFVLDAVADQIAIKEALRMNIPIIGVSDTNANPDQMDFPIPANDDGIKAIKIITETIMKAYISGKKEAGIETGKATPIKVVENVEAEGGEEVQLDPSVAEEAAAIEEEIEKEVIAESDRKVE